MASSVTVNTSFQTFEIWSRSFRLGETVLSVDPVGFNSVASFGRVLGDKSTLYKYLNPHLSVVTTVTPASRAAHVYILDTTTGAAVYAVELSDVVVGEGVKTAMVENWLVYAWLEVSGWRLASVELFEDRTDGKVETYVRLGRENGYLTITQSQPVRFCL